MSDETRTILLDSLPFLGLAVLYGLVSLLLAVSLLRERRSTWLGLGVWFLFALVCVASALVVALRLDGRDVLGGESEWLLWLGAAAVAVPGLIVLFRGRERSLLVTARRRVDEAEEEAIVRGREAAAVSRLSVALSRATSVAEAAELLLDEVEAALEPDAAMLALVDEPGGRAEGYAARGVDEMWGRGVVLELEEAGQATAVAHEGESPEDVEVSPASELSSHLTEVVGARSTAFVPLMSEEELVGVLLAATRAEDRRFGPPELDLLQGLAGEAALALGRIRSNEALRAALERERLVAEIGRRVRSNLDLETVLQVAVDETARAVGAARCFIRLGEPGEPMPVLTEWNAAGVGPVGDAAPKLPVLNLAVRERRTVVVGDVEADELLADRSLGSRESLLELGTRAVLATPILVFDRLIGVLAFHRAERTRWSAGEIALAEAVARELGLAIHTARLLGENESRIRRQETLIEAAQVLTSDLRFESVINRLVEEVVALTHADAADCWILESDRKLLRCRAVVGVPEWNVGRLIPPEGTIGRALESDRSVLTHDFGATEQPPPSPPYAVFNDVMCAPITWLGEARGVLGVCSREVGRFDDADLETLEAFARFASLALHNAESFEERERQTQVQRGFYRIAEVLGSPLSLAETFDALAQAACDALGGASALVLERRGDEFVLAGGHEIPQPVRQLFAAGVPAAHTPFSGPAERGQILTASEVAADERFDPSLRELCSSQGFASLLCAPVPGVRDQSYVAVVLFRERGPFTDDDVLLAQQLSGAARGALERSELFEAERRARTFSQRLARIGALLATSLDPAIVLEEVAREAPSLLGADTAVIRLLERDELVVRSAYGPGTEGMAGTVSPSEVGIAGTVAQSRAPVALADVAPEPQLGHGDALLEGPMTACVSVPMTGHGGGLYGVLSVYARTPRAWRDDETESLGALAAAASASVANAELYQRVAEEKERSGAILAHIADGIVAVDRDGRILLWNAMAEQITGVPAAEALGRRVPEVLQRELAAEGPWTAEERQVTIRRGADEVWLALTEAVMRDPAGEVAGRIFAFRDVSSERAVEQMKSDFVSTVSHELRTPLTSIYGFGETLMRADVDFSDAERLTFLRYMVSESERLIAIVDDLLNVARLEAGTLAVSLVPVDVGGVAREVVAAVEAHAGATHRLAVELPDDALVVRADREKLGQVLANLVDNAVKFSPEGGTVTITARRRAVAAEISVADEGLGIQHADRKRIFTKFFRSERGAGAGSAGTGLGLFIVRGLLVAMGGRIWVESEEGRGSRFTFELPLAEAEAADARPVEATSAT
ncbi:MAG TPA: GAF domain-containing protein [Gaiellaceae bacterium]|nr:GAF domain-containing protein [Gaiellaceae bacterium]